MNNNRFLLPSSIGLAVLAVIVSFVPWNSATAWIPISSVLMILSVIVYALRSIFASIDARLQKLEEEKK